ncbi:hypothetical protein PQQ51_11835 [Paraburkholderia xenovorans]|uniref:hypothetical protein n=1 Tax=Paraburkholderia xenovorans TaxID=36873 RepID=UPI0038BB7007
MRNLIALSMVGAIACSSAYAGVVDMTTLSGPTSRWAGAASGVGAADKSGMPLVPSVGTGRNASRDDYAMLPTERSLQTRGERTSRRGGTRQTRTRHAISVGKDLQLPGGDLAATQAPWSTTPWSGSPWTVSPW